MAKREKPPSIYVPSRHVHIGGNLFDNCPIILQFDKDPIIFWHKKLPAGYPIAFRIYHPDGTYLAKIVGPRIYPPAQGKKAGLKVRYPDNLTVLELNGKPIIEMQRTESAALKTAAEIYSPIGSLIRATGFSATPVPPTHEGIFIGDIIQQSSYEIINNHITGVKIAASLIDPGFSAIVQTNTFVDAPIGILVLSGKVPKDQVEADILQKTQGEPQSHLMPGLA